MLAYRDDIDGLRCLAVMLVVLFHVQLPFISGGYLGVDVFFVISGFLVTSVITNSMERGTFRFSNFYARRIRRLFPAVFVTVVASLVAGWFLFPPDAYSDLAQSSIATLLSGSNIYFWATSGYFETAAHYKPLLHTWSLAVEEQFYLVWPLSILLIAGRTPNRRRLAVALAVAVVLSTGLAEWMIRRDAMSAAFFLLPFRINEFAIGALVAFLPALKARYANEGLSLAGLAGVLVPSFLYTPETVFPGLSAMVPCVATAALIYAGPQTLLAKLFSLRPLTYVGRISYSVYLAHWPIIAFFLFWRGSAVGLSPVEQAVLVAASLALGALLYHLVETPFRVVRGEAKIGANLSNRGVGVWFAGSSLVAVVVAAFVWVNDGFEARYDTDGEIGGLVATMTRWDPEDVRLLNAEMQRARGSRRILVIGDSHAGEAIPSYRRWAIANDAVVFTKTLPGCIPLLDVNTQYSVRFRKDCEDRNFDGLRAELAQGYDLVVLHARWGLYTSESTDRRHGRFGNLNQPLSTERDVRRYQDVALTRERFGAALTKTVEVIERSGAKVLFVGQVPHLGRDPGECVVSAATIAEVRTRCIGATFEEVMAETDWATQRAEAVDGLAVFDPTPLLCPDSACMIVKNDAMLYRDADHLSKSGIEYLFTELGPRLQRLLDG